MSAAAAKVGGEEEQKTTMRAWRYTRVRGGIENSLSLEETAARPPWPPTTTKSHHHHHHHHVLVRVHYAALNPVDYKIADLGLLARLAISVPATPCLDFAGVVAALPPGTGSGSGEGNKGEEVEEEEEYKVGDRVFGRLEPTQFGALGEYVVAERAGLAKAPAGVDLRDLAGLGTAAATAVQCIAPNVAEGAGDRVFVNGGSGGTGTFGIQVAKALGCYVAASCSTPNVGLCRSLGADEVIDYRTADVSGRLRELAAKGGGFRLAVDNVGSAPRDLYKAADDYLDPSGKFVQVGVQMSLAEAGPLLSRALLPAFLGGGKRRWEFLAVRNSHGDLARLAGWMADGKLRVVVDQVFEFEEAPEAFRKLKTGRAKGKLVVKVAKEA